MNRNSLFRLIFVTFFIFWPLELRKWHGEPSFKPVFNIFSYNEQLSKILKSFTDKFLLYHTSLRIFFITHFRNSKVKK